MFDASRFMATEYQHRKEAVPVPDLAEFFDLEEGQKAEWIVRGLTANELARANEAETKNTRLSIIVEALSSANKSKSARVAEVQKALGFSDDVHGEVAKRLEMLVIGSVAPEIDLDVAVKLAEVRPIEFYALTNTISRLTGQGKEAEGKPKPSGKTD